MSNIDDIVFSVVEKIKCYQCMTDLRRRELLEGLYFELKQLRDGTSGTFDAIDDLLSAIDSLENDK